MTRAAPMPPEKRRSSIIEATIPLIERHGPGVTTRQVAEAAGVAEGTIFRVFDSLEDLIMSSIRSAFSKERLEELLAHADLGDTLEEKTRAALSLLNERTNTVRSLMIAMHHADGAPNRCLREELDLRRRELDDWLTLRFERHAAELSVPAPRFVAFLRLLSAGSSFPFDTGIEIETIVSIALYGAVKKDQA